MRMFNISNQGSGEGELILGSRNDWDLCQVSIGKTSITLGLRE